MRFSALMFDLDGTLLDTLTDIADSANQVLQSLGYPMHDVGDYRHFVGAGVRILFQRSLPENVVDDQIVTRCAEAFRDVYGQRWNVSTRLYDGIDTLLDHATACRLGMAVLSNKPDAFTKLCVEHYLAAWPLQPVVGQRDGIPPKPDPAGALEILQELQVPAERCLYLGDSDIDMQTATAAGLYPVGALWGFRSADELVRSGARRLVEHPNQLLDLLSAARGG
jgi:phosphoglycolate phosphatase